MQWRQRRANLNRYVADVDVWREEIQSACDRSRYRRSASLRGQGVVGGKNDVGIPVASGDGTSLINERGALVRQEIAIAEIAPAGSDLVDIHLNLSATSPRGVFRPGDRSGACVAAIAAIRPLLP